jgi:hypothetical protein
MSETLYSQPINVDTISTGNIAIQTDLLSQWLYLTPNAATANTITAGLARFCNTYTQNDAFWSNVSRYTTLSTITAGNYIGGVTAHDGRIFMPSYGATNTGVFNPRTNSFTTISGSPINFFGGVLIPDGRIVLVPNSATVIGLINPVTSTYTAGPSALGVHAGGCLLPNGTVFLSPAGATTCRYGIYNPTTGVYTSYTTNGWAGYEGAVLVPDGRVIMVPTNVSNLGIYNFNTNSYSTINISPYTGYSTAVYHPNGNVYFAPWTATNIGIFNTTTNSFSTRSGITAGQRGSCLLPDGRIMFSPGQTAITFTNIYNPYTNTLSTITGLPINSFIGCTLLQDGRVLLVPWSTSLGIVTQCQGVPSDFTLHPFFNKF